MSNLRRAKKVDANQPAIVAALLDIPGVSVELDHDDILVGYRGANYWFEIKDPDECANKDGVVFESSIRPKQKLLRATWRGQYSIVTTLKQILTEIGVLK